MRETVKESLPFYHSAQWKKVRAQALNRDGGMCRDCMDALRAGGMDRPRRATMVHHMIPIDERPELALNLDNLRSLCAACHAARHPEKGGAERADQEMVTRVKQIRVIKI